MSTDSLKKICFSVTVQPTPRPEFIRVGASYIVNLTFVRRIAGNTLEIADGAHITIPRRRSEEVKKTYMDFCRKEAFK